MRVVLTCKKPLEVAETHTYEPISIQDFGNLLTMVERPVVDRNAYRWCLKHLYDIEPELRTLTFDNSTDVLIINKDDIVLVIEGSDRDLRLGSEYVTTASGTATKIRFGVVKPLNVDAT